MNKYNPSRYNQVVDFITHKFPQDAPVYGKPNVVINPQGIELGMFVNLALSKYSPSELIELAETCSSSPQGQTNTIRRILEKPEREKNSREHNRANTYERLGPFGEKR